MSLFQLIAHAIHDVQKSIDEALLLLGLVLIVEGIHLLEALVDLALHFV